MQTAVRPGQGPRSPGSAGPPQRARVMTRPNERLPRPAVTAALVALAAMLLPPDGQKAWAQATRTVRLVVPYTAGSPSDIPARLLAEQISRSEGVTVIVENRPGGNGMVGAESVARAEPDGSTLLIATAAFLIDPHLRKLSYQPLTSFEPICQLTTSPTVVTVNSASPYHSLADLLEMARGKPAAVTMAGVGPASTVHIAFEVLKREAKVDMTFIPYPGAAPALSALMGGHVTSAFVPYGGTAEHLRTGKIRALATSSHTRIEALPAVPTIAESGYNVLGMDVWFGVVAPAKTSKDNISRLAGRFTAALRTPEIGTKLA